MKVVSVKKGMFWGIAEFKATQYEEAFFNSFLGAKRFWVSKGAYKTMRVPKKWNLKIGESIPLQTLVLRSSNIFNWEWYRY